MRVVQLTAGTGSFICGTCVRDNALVAALRGLGHDASLVPLYLPVTTDEPNQSTGPVLAGGVRVYATHAMPTFSRLFGRLLDARGLLDLAAKRAGSTAPQSLGALTVDMLEGPRGRLAPILAELAQTLQKQPKPDVLLLSNALLLGLAPALRHIAPVVCTLQGEDGFLDALGAPWTDRAWALVKERANDVAGFVAVSDTHAKSMISRGNLPSGRVRVVPNGIALEGYADLRPGPAAPTLGFLARLCPDKGLDRVADAYLRLRERHPTLRFAAAGTMTAADRPFVESLRRRLGPAATFLPNVTRAEKLSFLAGLTVLSVAPRVPESFGLYVLEALAAGVPVVVPRTGALPEVVERFKGGLVADDTPEALADAVDRLLRDEPLRRRLGEEGRANALSQGSATVMADGVARALADLTV